MCKHCIWHCVLSTIATWAFFALLLSALGGANSSMNAIGLTILLFIAMYSCPLMNPKLLQCRDVVVKKKK
jgi:hypothetical protein